MSDGPDPDTGVGPDPLGREACDELIGELLGMAHRESGDAVRADLSVGEEERELRSLREEIERRNAEAVRRARHEPLPPAVAAYREVYGRLPEGWPHPDM